MEVKSGTSATLALIFLAMMILLHTNTNICKAAADAAPAAPPVMKKSSNSSGGVCEGRPKGSLIVIGDMDLDDELLIMDSDISRRLMASSGKTVTGGTIDPKKAAISCGQGIAYEKCTPKPGKIQHIEHCGNYNRGCY